MTALVTGAARRLGRAMVLELARRGVPVGIGAHGQEEGLASHWELWSFVRGGMSPVEALKAGDVDLVLTDDGLQHYGLHRDIEIAVLDGARGLGNGKLLPAGPLREPIQRLSEVDFVVANGDL